MKFKNPQDRLRAVRLTERPSLRSPMKTTVIQDSGRKSIFMKSQNSREELEKTLVVV